MFEALPAHPAARKRWQHIAGQNGNLFAELIETVETCFLGQITNALFEVGGQYRRNMQTIEHVIFRTRRYRCQIIYSTRMDYTPNWHELRLRLNSRQFGPVQVLSLVD